MVTGEEIATITNKVSGLLVEAETAAAGQECLRFQSQALLHSCQFLQRLSEDASLFDQYATVTQAGDVESARLIPGLRYGAVEAVSKDIGHFKHFLRRENKLLVESGMNPKLADWIVERVEMKVDQLSKRSPSAGDLKSSLKVLERHVCSQGKKLLAALHRGRWRHIILSSFGGVSLISVNISAAGILSPVGVGASASIGGGLVMLGVKELLES